MNLNLGLDAVALERRRKFVTASDASKLMEGRWREVYASKMGAPDDDLSNELRVQLGSFTEPFCLAWAWKQTGRPITYYSDNPLHAAAWEAMTGHKAKPEFVASGQYPFMGCSLDGITTTAQGDACPIDAKHVGKADDPMVMRYTPAGVHQATVMGCDFWSLAVLVGNGRFDLITQEVDPLYQAELIATEREFWSWVERGEEPEDRTPGAPPPKPQPKLREIIVPTDNPELSDLMLRQNNWLGETLAEFAAFASTEAAAKRHAISRKKIGELIPADVGLLRYGLAKAKRDGRGLTITVEQARGRG